LESRSNLSEICSSNLKSDFAAVVASTSGDYGPAHLGVCNRKASGSRRALTKKGNNPALPGRLSYLKLQGASQPDWLLVLLS
jgi:hypothetical protein